MTATEASEHFWALFNRIPNWTEKPHRDFHREITRKPSSKDIVVNALLEVMPCSDAPPETKAAVMEYANQDWEKAWMIALMASSGNATAEPAETGVSKCQKM